MDEVHEMNRADRMAKDIADILERLSALEKKLDFLFKKLVSRSGTGEINPKPGGRKKKVRKQGQKKKTKA
jgi:hypothetical protein